MPDPFERVALGRTALSVTRLSLGTGALGWLYTPVAREQALATVRQALDLGGRLLDTAPLYGSGRAEARLGAALAGRPRDSFAVATKVGYVLDPAELPDDAPPPRPLGHDFSYDGVLRSLDGSLKRLGLDRVDLLHIHDPDEHLDAAVAGAYRALRRLRDEGAVAAIGAGMNRGDLLAQLVERIDLDCVLLAGRYTLLDQSALADLLPLAAARGVAVIVGGPFNSGILTDPHAPGATFNYAPADQAWLTKARAIDAVCQRHGVPIKAAALQFPLGHPAVATVLAGARSPAEVSENAAMMRTPIPPALWDDLRAAGLIAAGAPAPPA